MLYQLLDRICQQIDRMNIDAETPRMLAQIDRVRPELRRQLAKTSTSSDAQALVARAVAGGALRSIKGIPEIARFLAAKTKDGRVSPQIKCALASVLAYLVQPRDLVPDDAPGGYGYLDDSAVLRAGLIEFLKLEPTKQFDLAEQEKLVNMVASLLPPAALPMLQLTVGNMALAFQVMSMFPADVAQLTLQQIVAYPLQAAAPAAPAGFTPGPAPSYGGGHWSGGAYFEGDNVVVPGGPSLIGGELVMP